MWTGRAPRLAPEARVRVEGEHELVHGAEVAVRIVAAVVEDQEPQLLRAFARDPRRVVLEVELLVGVLAHAMVAGIEPMTRSQYPFCQGERGAERICRISSAFTYERRKAIEIARSRLEEAVRSSATPALFELRTTTLSILYSP